MTLIPEGPRAPTITATQPLLNTMSSNSTVFSTAGPTALPPQPGQPNPNPAMFQQHGASGITQALPTTVDPFYGLGLPTFQAGLGPPTFQAGHGLQPLTFSQATGHYHLPTMVPQVPYMHIPGSNYQYLRPYENVQPPVYPPVNWQPTYSYPVSPPTFNAGRGLSGSLRRRRSPSPSVETEDPLDYPELREWLNGVDRDHLRGRWGHNFSQFSARLELAGFMSLLHLEHVTLNILIGMTGMEEIAAERLLRFVREDVSEHRATKSPRPKRTRYSYQ